jgi:hypothetical protein
VRAVPGVPAALTVQAFREEAAHQEAGERDTAGHPKTDNDILIIISRRVWAKNFTAVCPMTGDSME